MTSAEGPFSQQPFMPHGMCYLWNPSLLALHVVSDGAIAVAYFSIPLLLFYFVRKRRDVPFENAFTMFGLFIVACGITHVMGILTVWYPAFWLDGAIKGVTGVVSLATAVMLVPMIPKALALRTPASLEQLNTALQRDLDRRREALAESERQYATLAEALPQIVWTADRRGQVDYFNKSYFDYTASTTDIRGWNWDRVLHPEDVPHAAAAWQDAVESAAPAEFECRVRRGSDGAYRSHIVRAVPVKDRTGSVVRWFGTCNDIDDLKRAFEAAGRYAEQVRLNAQLEDDLYARKCAEEALRASEERFRQVEEHAPIGLAIVALDGTFTRVNSALCKIVGYSQDELLTANFQQLTHPDDLQADLDFVQQLLDGRIDSYEMQKRYFHKDGVVVWAALNASLVRLETGDPLYFIAQIQDISERRASEHALEVARKAALAASETKSRFLAMMSHEIRTPMNGIIGMSELLLLTRLSEEQHEYAKVVRDSGRSLLRVLNDILDYSKIEAGKLDLENIDFDVASQIRSVVSLLGPQFSAKRVSLSTEIAPAVPHGVKGDPGRLRQILINLIGNALKFTPAGGFVSIFVERGVEREGHVPIRFTIRDTGVGIEPEALHRLFRPFSQADDSTTRKFGGTGLGLSICKQLVDMMAGEIAVESTPGAGTSFWFSIPFAPGHTPERVLDAPAREMGDRRRGVRPRPEKLLLAEDNEINALLALRQFKRLGFSVTVVSDGQQAVEALARESFDLVFMDAQMPNMDGFEATRRIRKFEENTQRRVPIVAMTADAQREDREICLAAGMDDFLSKPVTLEDLQAATERWLIAARTRR